MATTTTLYKIIHSEMNKRGYDEYVDSEGNLKIFDKDHQILGKILNYDNEIDVIVNELFSDLKLNHPEYDRHFKKMFIYRFLNREINRQTIEAFQVELMYVFMSNQAYINRVYEDLERFLSQESTTKQETNQESNENTRGDTFSTNTQNTIGNTKTNSNSKNHNANATLPQTNTSINLDNDTLTGADDYRKDYNKSDSDTNNTSDLTGESTSNNTGESSSNSSSQNYMLNHAYRLDELFKTNGMMENILNQFDRKCFLQFW